MGTGFLALIISGRKFVIHLRHDRQDFIDGRTKAYPESIGARSRETFGVDPPGAKHVIGTNQRFIVEEHVGVGVKTLEDQIDVVARENIRSNVEGSLIFPIGLTYPLQLL